MISLPRLLAVMRKEFVQMRRDRVTFAMMVGIPMLQLVLFGYAINTNPKHLPTAAVLQDHGSMAQRVLAGLRNSEYFDIVRTVDSEEEADMLLKRGAVQFVISIPDGFERRLLRGERPQLLLEADATDPAATGNATAAVDRILRTVFQHDLRGPLAELRAGESPVDLRIHARYNPEIISQYNIVPGLMGVVLTMTMVIITALAITRERERGTMENLLATPVRPLEVLLGKIIPYIAVGYIQITLIIIAAKVLFRVPVEGSLPLLYLCALVFIVATLAVGIMFSTAAKNQLQAVQMAFFFFLPNILLSGFMFPFRGMPQWAQAIGTVLPITHFLRIVRGIMLKGNGLPEILPELWPIALFAVVALSIGLKRYRETLD